jgi:GH25 family lysozyme M1 (1,4-beta-N-acetylmuramidase)
LWEITLKKGIFKKSLFTLLFSSATALLFTPLVGSTAATAQMPAAGNASLKVIDISHYNISRDSGGNYLYDNIKWTTVKSNVRAVYIKATEGTTYTDPCFADLAGRLQNTGISQGFYHYFWPNADAAANRRQADYFYSVVKSHGYDCVPVLDVEETNSSRSLPSLSKAQMTSAVTAFAEEFKKKSGRDIMIYTSNYFIDEHFLTSLAKYKLWVARWDSGNPTDTGVWHNYDMWQYTAKLTVSGLSGLLDGNKATGNIFLNAISGMTRIDVLKNTYGPGDIEIPGWALSYYGVTRVDVYVDGKAFGAVPKADFAERTDVDARFGGAGYDDALNSGYTYTIPDGKLFSGKHIVRVAALNSRGAAVWSDQKTFYVKVPENKTGLDKFSSTPYTEDVSVSGWSVSRFGIKRFDVYIDGKRQATVRNTDLTERTDVERLYGNGGYTDLEHCGFTITVPNASLSGGTHSVRFASVDNMGKVVWSSVKSFTVTAPANKVRLDKPTATSYAGDVTVAGWAISHFGVKRVDVYLDGKQVTTVRNSLMTAYANVRRIYGGLGYNDLAHSGYAYTIPGATLSGGSHTVRVAMIDQTGKVLWAPTKTFTVIVPEDKIGFSNPSVSSSGDITVSGFAISHFGVSRVDIYADGAVIASVQSAAMTENTAVETTYANQGYSDLAHSGYAYAIPAGTLSTGTHTIRVAMVNGSGKVLLAPQTTITVSQSSSTSS